MKLRTTLIVAGLLSAAACSDQTAITAPASATAARSALRFADVSTATSLVGTTSITLGAAPSSCLSVANGINADGSSITPAPCDGGAAQQFTFDATGAIRIYGDKCLDADMGTGQNGDRVQIWTCNGYNQQRWALTSSGNIVGIGGKCVDLDYGRTTPGTKVQLWTCYPGNTNQQFATSGLTSPTSVTASGSPGSAQLPRTYLNTAMPTPTGNTIAVPAGGDLQAALNSAQPGDVITLAAGATYVGNFVLPAKSGMTSSQWITVRTAGALPAEGTRVTPASAVQLPKVLTPNAAAAIATTPGTQGWRLTGLEIGGTSGLTMTYGLVTFGDAGTAQNTTAQIPSRIVLDRSYVHGSPTLDVRRCIALNSASTAVIDSYVSECHSRNGDSQAIMGWNGPGPFKVVNNRLEGAHENIAFGGSDPSISGLIPSDIEIRRNYVIKPLSWRGVWTAKNLVEIKAGQRVLLESNVFENNWVDGQQGFAFIWWSANADGNALWSVTQDITFRSNIVRNVPGGFNLTDRYNASLPRMSRVTIYNNVITGIDPSNGRLYQVNGTVAGVTIANNSGFGINHDLVFVTPDQPLSDLVFRGNITGAQYTLFAAGYMGDAALAKMGIPAANVTGNVFASGSGAGAVPSNNSYAGSQAAIGFVNLSAGDLTLASSSPFIASGTSGTRPGADVATINQATLGVAQ